MSNKEITKQSYQLIAKEFANNVAELAPIASIEKFMDLIDNTNAKIIDIGCGSGRDAKIFTDKGLEVIGIDFCSNLIDIAKNHAPLAQFQLMDIEEMDFSPNSFDGAWAACSLLHIAKKSFPEVLQKINHILKKDAIFYLALKRGQGETIEQDLRYQGDIKKFWSFYEEDELKTILRNAKFEILECSLVERSVDYQTHQAFRVFCQKS